MSSTAASSTLGTSDIVGIVIGGVLGLVTIIGLIFSCYEMCCKKKNNKAQVAPEQYPYYPPNGAYGQPMNTGYYHQQLPYQQPPYQQPPYQQSFYHQSPYNKQPTNNEQPPPPYSAVYPGNTSNGKY